MSETNPKKCRHQVDIPGGWADCDRPKLHDGIHVSFEGHTWTTPAPLAPPDGWPWAP